MTRALTPEEKTERRLRQDTGFYAESVLRIVDEHGNETPFKLWPTQDKVLAALERQRRAGRPQRVIVLKSRRTGCSSVGMARLTQRTTLKPNRRAQIVAQDRDTASELFELVETFHARLPGPEQGAPDWLKPPLAYARSTDDTKLLHFGTEARLARRTGDLGINSTLKIDTAKEASKGRGKTITDLWLTEVAFWPNPEKMLALASAVFDSPDTMIVFESTANGHNEFKARWDRAVRGEGMFEPVFLSWLDDWKLRLPFQDPDERRRFEERLGTGEWGDGELDLLARSMKDGRTRLHALEQLHWRYRIGIPDKADGRLDYFRQEYPSTPMEAFIASGRNVFSAAFVQRALDRAEAEAAEQGLLTESGTKTHRLMNGEMEIPTGALWVPRAATGFGSTHDFWKVYEHPWRGWEAEQARAQGLDGPERENALERLAEREGSPRWANPGQYIIGVDSSDGLDHGDFHAIQVIDHLTGEQCAVYRSKVDKDLLTWQVALAGYYFNLAWVAVEVTGSHGLPVARDLQFKLLYPRVYTQTRHTSGKDKQEDRLGWDTNRRTKPLMLKEMTALLREGTDGIRDRDTALELSTYVEHENGKTGADSEAFDDLVMAYMIAQQVRTEVPARRFSPPGGRGPALHRGPRKPRL